MEKSSFVYCFCLEILRMYKHFIVFKYHVNKYSYIRTNFHEYVLTRTHICSFYTYIIEHTFTIRTNIRKNLL